MLNKKLVLIFSFLVMTLMSFAEDIHEVCKDSDLQYILLGVAMNIGDLKICENENEIIIVNLKEDKVHKFNKTDSCIDVHIDKLFGDKDEKHCKNDAPKKFRPYLLEMIKYVNYAISLEKETQKNIKTEDETGESWPLVQEPEEDTELYILNQIKDNLCNSLDDKTNISCQEK
jgi:hypothetical protein